MKIQILVENSVRKRGLQAEHGLSLWLEIDDIDLEERSPSSAQLKTPATSRASETKHNTENETCHILFDTGQTDLYVHNAQKMGIDLSKADRLVLSHGHYDHSGGLPFYPCWEHGPRLIAHPAAFQTQIKTGEDGRSENIGPPWQQADFPDIVRHIVPNTHTLQISDCCYACANIPATRSFEMEAAKQFMIKGISDEQFLVIDRPHGLVVIVGCSHPGIISCLDFAEKCFPGKSIAAVIGGMHLADVSQERLNLTVQAFEDKAIPMLVPLHCTGTQAIHFMHNKLGDRVHLAQTGDVLEIL